MILPVVFPYRMTYVVYRGRRDRSETFVDDAFVELAEPSAAEAPLAFVVHPGPSDVHLSRGGRLAPDRPVDVVAFDGRLYWPLLAEHGGPLTLTAWRRWLQRGRTRPYLGRKRAPSDPRRDPLALVRPERSRRRPWRRASGLLDVRVLADGREAAVLELARRATDVILRDGRLFAAGLEPVWSLYPGPAYWSSVSTPGALELRAEDLVAATDRAAGPHGGLLPFAHCEFFRADRTDDVAARAAALVAASRGAIAPGGACRIDVTGAWQPKAVPLAVLLARLETCLRDYVEQKMRAARHAVGWETAEADVLRAADAEIRVMAQFPPTDSIDVHVLASQLRDLSWALEDVPVPRDDLLLTYADDLRGALVRARERYSEDLAAGLLPDRRPSPRTEEEDDAIAAVA